MTDVMPPPDGNRRRSSRAMLGVGVVVVFLAVSIGLAEVALRTMFDPLRVLDGDAMWEYRWRQTRATQGSAGDAAPEYPFDVYDAVLGWKPRAGYHRGGVRTNSLGIRAEREFAFERPHGTSRVVIVGNSFMWGEGVANEHTFASRLDDLLPATEVINLGVHGYGTDQQLWDGFTKETGIKVNVVEGNHDELIQRMESEGANSPADIFITVDAGRLAFAADKDLFAPVKSEILEKDVPAYLRHPDGLWYGLAVRARVLRHARRISGDRERWRIVNRIYRQGRRRTVRVLPARVDRIREAGRAEVVRRAGHPHCAHPATVARTGLRHRDVRRRPDRARGRQI